MVSGARVLVALTVAATIAAVAWYDDRDDRGLRVVQVTSPPSDQAVGTTQVIEVRDGWRHHGGFFLFPLLFIVLVFWCIGALFRCGGPGWPGRGHWNERFEDWHRRQHGGESQAPPAASA